MKGRIIFEGKTQGEALVSEKPVSFYGGVDPETGVVVEQGHPLEGKSVKGKILVFPEGKGSTVGSYTIYRLAKGSVGPKAIINKKCETIVAVGAIISEIPCVDSVNIKKIKTGDTVKVEKGNVTVVK